MHNWLDYTDTVDTHSVVGTLKVLKDFHSPQLDNARDVLVWLPPSYAGRDRRYPVLYMHDAQNLFDAGTSYVGEWMVDETMTALADEGLEAIVVGLPNQSNARALEYNPYPPGLGAAYVAFLADTVKPLIDGAFRTLPAAAHTGVAGSSMGGLISLYAFLMRGDVFSTCGAFSTAYWFGENGLLRTIAGQAGAPGHIYLDVGTAEGEVTHNWGLSPDLETGHRDYVQGVRDLRDALLERGYRAGDSLLYVEDEGAIHRECAWAARLPTALRFLLGPMVP
jgi:predicted alpha/beta superfamily hydrolase